jgi:hypothetical protein
MEMGIIHMEKLGKVFTRPGQKKTIIVCDEELIENKFYKGS